MPGETGPRQEYNNCSSIVVEKKSSSYPIKDIVNFPQHYSVYLNCEVFVCDFKRREERESFASIRLTFPFLADGNDIIVCVLDN